MKLTGQRLLLREARLAAALRFGVVLAMLAYAASVLILALTGQDPNGWITTFIGTCMMAIAGLCVWSSTRIYHSFVEAGRWRERMEVISSMREAQERGMSTGDWIVGYQEKLVASMNLTIVPDDED